MTDTQLEARERLHAAGRTNVTVAKALSFQRMRDLTDEETYLVLALELVRQADELAKVAAQAVDLAPAPFVMNDIWCGHQRGGKTEALRIREARAPEVEAPVQATTNTASASGRNQHLLGEADARSLFRLVKPAGKPSAMVLVDVCECKGDAQHGPAGGVCGGCGGAILGQNEKRHGGKYWIGGPR